MSLQQVPHLDLLDLVLVRWRGLMAGWAQIWSAQQEFGELPPRLLRVVTVERLREAARRRSMLGLSAFRSPRSCSNLSKPGSLIVPPRSAL